MRTTDTSIEIPTRKTTGHSANMLNKESTNEQDVRSSLAISKIVFNNVIRILCSSTNTYLRKTFLVFCTEFSSLWIQAYTREIRQRIKQDRSAVNTETDEKDHVNGNEEMLNKIKERRNIRRVTNN